MSKIPDINKDGVGDEKDVFILFRWVYRLGSALRSFFK